MTDLDPESLRLLQLAHEARTPNEEDKVRVGRKLAAALGASVIAAGTASVAAKASASTAPAAAGAGMIGTAGSAVIAKWVAGGVVLAAAALGYVALSAVPEPERATPRPAAQAPSVLAPATPPEDAPVEGAAEPEQQEAAAAASTDAPAQAPNAQAPRRTAHRRPAAQSDALGAELELLHRAQTAWRARHAAQALALVSEHRTRYPHSQLELERDALQALSLCELGRVDDARRIARSVLARAPLSPLRASLEQSCALK